MSFLWSSKVQIVIEALLLVMTLPLKFIFYRPSRYDCTSPVDYTFLIN